MEILFKGSLLERHPKLNLFLVLLLNVFRIEMTLSLHENDVIEDESFKTYRTMLYNLDKRITSLEQPGWEVVRSEKKWIRCQEGPCRCSKETLTLSCWRLGLVATPRYQVVPVDIKVIDLSSNELSSLHKNTFHDLARLTDLDISNNKLNYLPGSIFQSLTSLRNLKLRQNQLETMTGDRLREQANLEILDLSMNRLSLLDGWLLSSCRRLRAVNLARNRLEDLPGELFSGLERLEDLDLSENGIRELRVESFSGLRSLATLDISRNNLTYLPTGLFRDTKELVVLAASSNHLSFIGEKLFIQLNHLSFLDLTANQLSEMSGTHLEPGLLELHLGQNRLQRVPVLPSDLPSLQRLFLFSNQIRYLPTSVFSGYPSLRTLSLNHNLIAGLEAGVFAPLRQLRNLQLDSNKLAHLPADCFKENTKLSGLKLTKNPWHCDCRIWNFANWLRENKDKVWGLEPTCLGPGELGGRPIDEVTFAELCENNSSHNEDDYEILPLIK